ncbi:hypothetical protein [Ornithinimicrobium sufpigmenti]|nr:MULTISPECIES: hypothetical protein [unclassified Ornithinimicrobium]
MSGDTAQAAVDRVLAERGPIPHHRLQPIARAVRQAIGQDQTPAKKPA